MSEPKRRVELKLPSGKRVTVTVTPELQAVAARADAALASGAQPTSSDIAALLRHVRFGGQSDFLQAIADHLNRTPTMCACGHPSVLHAAGWGCTARWEHDSGSDVCPCERSHEGGD